MKGVAGWLFQRFSGLLLIAGLLIHFAVMHFSGPEQITHAVVLRRLSNPLWKVFDLAFLSVLLYHGFNGIWGIAMEYIPSPGLLRASRAALLLMAALLALAGIYIVTL